MMYNFLFLKQKYNKCLVLSFKKNFLNFASFISVGDEIMSFYSPRNTTPHENLNIVQMHTLLEVVVFKSYTT